MTPSLDQNTWVTSLLWAKQMKSLESNETITSSQLKIIVIYMWEITCFLHNNFQLSEIPVVSGVWEMRNFKKFDCLVFCSIIATRPSDKSTVTATRPVWLCHSSGTIGRWFWRPLHQMCEWLNFGTFFKFPCIVRIYACFFIHFRNHHSNSHTNHIITIKKS